MSLQQNQTHESVGQTDVKMPSERSFGVVFTVVFLIVGLWPLLRNGEPRLWSLLAAGGLVIVTGIAPTLLRPANRLWFRFGLLLHRLVSPLILGLIFYGVFTPIGRLMRWRGQRPLDLEFDPSSESYWVDRRDDAPAPATMTRQF